MSTENRTDIATPIFAALFIAVGALVLWDTTTYADADSYVFPRTVAIIMIGLCILLVLRWLLFGRRADLEEQPSGSFVRRVVLVLAMIGAALAMPYIGFLISGFLAFGIIMLAAMYDPWTPFRLVVYPLAGLAIVLGFYLLFSYTLQVPLPVGALFNG